MKQKSTAQGVNPEQLRRLFNIGRDTEKAGKKRGGSQHKAEMLCSSLSHTLPFDKSQIDMLPSKLSQLCHSIGLLAGDTIADLLGNPSTDMSYIKGIKLYSKEL